MQGGAGPPFRNPPSCLGHWGDLRSSPSGLQAASGDPGKIDSHTRAEPLLAATLELVRSGGALACCGAGYLAQCFDQALAGARQQVEIVFQARQQRVEVAGGVVVVERHPQRSVAGAAENATL